MQRHEAQVTLLDVDARLDVFAAALAGVTRSRAARWLTEGRVAVNGIIIQKAGFRLSAGQRVSVDVPPPAPSTVLPEALPLHILYEDADLAVVDKPCGMVVHPAAGNANGTLVHALLYHIRDLSGVGGILRPGIVHRLDKDTSGALLIAKHDKAHQMLSAQFKARTLCKVYAALAVGRFAVPQGRVDAPIARDGKDRKRMAVVAGGRPAATLYRVAMQWPQAALLKLRLVTGRTHQIRVHMRHLGHPLAGDAIYGDRRAAPTVPRLMLHARSITFTHPITDERLRVEAPWPQDFLTVLQKLSNPAETAALAEAFAGFDTLQVLDGLAE